MRERLYPIFFVAVLGFVAALVLTLANSAFTPMYEANKEREAKGNVLIALGIEGWDKARVRTATIDQIKAAFDRSIIVRTVRIEIAPGRDKDIVFYEGYRDEAKTDLVGYAFKVSGAGFWDRISGYLAVDPAVEKVIGLTFYEDYETPGLGHKINDPEWLTSWIGRSVHKPGTDTLRINIVPPGAELKDNEVHAISGATETSGALQKFLNAQLNEFVKAVTQYRKSE